MWEKTKKVLGEYCIVVKERYSESLIKNGRVATEKLLESIDCTYRTGHTSVKVTLKLADYWKYVEWDTRPHYPPLDDEGKSVLEDWIEAKIESGNFIVKPDDNGKLPTPKQLSYLIGRAMAGESPNQSLLKNPQGGTKGTHDLANTLEEVNQIYLEKIEEAILEDVSDDVVSIIIGIRTFE